MADGIDVPGDTLACDPDLQTLAANVGATLTQALGADSCAVDADADGAGLDSDQRGAPFVRVFGAAADIGAFERQRVSDVVFADGFENPAR